MKGYTLDYYEKWERDGILDKRLNEIKELISKGVPQVEIAKILGMSEKTMYKLKNRHPKMNQAFVFGNDDLKYTLIDTLIKKAVGYEYEETQTTIEETKTGTKKKIVKYKKKAQPDMNALCHFRVVVF
jgi:predicted transcriptional regulator